MDAILKRIFAGLRELFPDLEDVDLTPQMPLIEVPDWDSMAAVNLQSFLEQQFQVRVPQDLLSEETTLAEIAGFVLNPATMQQTA
jgi:acyl carrier protein